MGSGGFSPTTFLMWCRQSPVLMATGIPPTMPLRLVSGVLKSPCASIQTSPTLWGFHVGPERWCPASIPIRFVQLLRIPIGNRSFLIMAATWSAPWLLLSAIL